MYVIYTHTYIYMYIYICIYYIYTARRGRGPERPAPLRRDACEPLDSDAR